MKTQERSGPGPVMVYVHGFPNNARLWREQLAAVRTHAVTVDMERQDSLDQLVSGVAALVKDLKARHPEKAVHLIGHDLGCFVVSEVSLQAASFVERQVLINGVALDQFASRFRSLAQWRRSYYVPCFNLPLLPALARTWLNAFCRDVIYDRSGVAPDSVLRQPAANNFEPIGLYRDLTRKAVVNAFRGTHQRRCNVPTILVSGNADPFLITPRAVEFDRFFDTATHVSVAGGHWLPVTHPGQINHIIADGLVGKELTA